MTGRTMSQSITSMNITIEIDGVVRRYTLDKYDTLNTDWTEEVADIIDTLEHAN
jgi:hypothetical protein